MINEDLSQRRDDIQANQQQIAKNAGAFGLRHSVGTRPGGLARNVL